MGSDLTNGKLESNKDDDSISISKTTFIYLLLFIAVFVGLFLAYFMPKNDLGSLINNNEKINNNENAENGNEKSIINGGFQEIYIKATPYGYDKKVVRVKKGIPVKLYFSADKYAGCGKIMLIREFGITLESYDGETVQATFTPNKEGSYEYSCAMRMFRGTLIVE
ncbi:MAG: cupredoxin domain-containing protein [Candidatus Anstonellales archaeon]